MMYAAEQRLCLTLQKVALADLQKIKVLGQGAFGQVMLVKHAQQYYALKILSKEQIIAQGLQVQASHQAIILALICTCYVI